MPGYCCKPKKGLTNDSSIDLMLSVVANRTRPKSGWPAAGNGGKCCPQERNGTACSCYGNANPLNNTNIYRNTQIHQVIKNCECKQNKRLPGERGSRERSFDIFNSLDTNRDGNINRSEFVKHGNDEVLFNSIDTNKDGNINRVELETFWTAALDDAELAEAAEMEAAARKQQPQQEPEGTRQEPEGTIIVNYLDKLKYLGILNLQDEIDNATTKQELEDKKVKLQNEIDRAIEFDPQLVSGSEVVDPVVIERAVADGMPFDEVRKDDNINTLSLEKVFPSKKSFIKLRDNNELIRSVGNNDSNNKSKEYSKQESILQETFILEDNDFDEITSIWKVSWSWQMDDNTAVDAVCPDGNVMFDVSINDIKIGTFKLAGVDNKTLTQAFVWEGNPILGRGFGHTYEITVKATNFCDNLTPESFWRWYEGGIIDFEGVAARFGVGFKNGVGNHVERSEIIKIDLDDDADAKADDGPAPAVPLADDGPAGVVVPPAFATILANIERLARALGVGVERFLLPLFNEDANVKRVDYINFMKQSIIDLLSQFVTQDGKIEKDIILDAFPQFPQLDIIDADENGNVDAAAVGPVIENAIEEEAEKIFVFFDSNGDGIINIDEI